MHCVVFQLCKQAQILKLQLRLFLLELFPSKIIMLGARFLTIKCNFKGDQVLGVGLIGQVNTRPLIFESSFKMASGGQEEPFSRLALYVELLLKGESIPW